MDKKRPGGDFGKRLKDRFLMDVNGESVGSEIDPNLVSTPSPPKNRFTLQSFFNFQGKAVKPVCECGTFIHDKPYWIGTFGPLCYSCYLRGDKN